MEIRRANCKQCGKDFRQNRIDHIFCTTKCGVTYRKGKQENVILKCPQCGIDFVQQTAKQVFCVKECRIAYYYKELDKNTRSREKTKEKREERLKKREELKEEFGMAGRVGRVKYQAKGDGIMLHTESFEEVLIEEELIVRRAVINIWKKSAYMEKLLIEGMNPDINFSKYKEDFATV